MVCCEGLVHLGSAFSWCSFQGRSSSSLCACTGRSHNRALFICVWPIGNRAYREGWKSCDDRPHLLITWLIKLRRRLQTKGLCGHVLLPEYATQNALEWLGMCSSLAVWQIRELDENECVQKYSEEFERQKPRMTQTPLDCDGFRLGPPLNYMIACGGPAMEESLSSLLLLGLAASLLFQWHVTQVSM